LDYGVLPEDEIAALMCLRAAGSWGFPFAKSHRPTEFLMLGRRLVARGYATAEHTGTPSETFFINPRGFEASLTLAPQIAEQAA
jgi:hypothetical protein